MVLTPMLDQFRRVRKKQSGKWKIANSKPEEGRKGGVGAGIQRTDAASGM